jgi:hypothetical protein
MTMITCPRCGEQTFTITGWADLDHCASCGQALGDGRGARVEDDRLVRDLRGRDPNMRHGAKPVRLAEDDAAHSR